MLQCVAVCCSVMQCVAVCRSASQCVAVWTVDTLERWNTSQLCECAGLFTEYVGLFTEYLGLIKEYVGFLKEYVALFTADLGLFSEYVGLFSWTQASFYHLGLFRNVECIAIMRICRSLERIWRFLSKIYRSFSRICRSLSKCGAIQVCEYVGLLFPTYRICRSSTYRICRFLHIEYVGPTFRIRRTYM